LTKRREFLESLGAMLALAPAAQAETQCLLAAELSIRAQMTARRATISG
jgi:hypothetical protein